MMAAQRPCPYCSAYSFLLPGSIGDIIAFTMVCHNLQSYHRERRAHGDVSEGFSVFSVCSPMKIPIPWGPLGCDLLQGDGVAQGFEAMDQATPDMLAVSLIEVVDAQVFVEAVLVGY